MKTNFLLSIGWLTILTLFSVSCAQHPVPIKTLGTIGVEAWPENAPDQESKTTSVLEISKNLYDEIAERTVSFSAGALYGCIRGLTEPSSIKHAIADAGIMETPEAAMLQLVAFVAVELGYCGYRGTIEAFDLAANPKKRYERSKWFAKINREPSVWNNTFVLDEAEEKIRGGIFTALQGNTSEPARWLDYPLEYEQLLDEGIDTVLELNLEEVYILTRTSEELVEGSIYIKINVRLINTAVKKEVFEETFDYSHYSRSSPREASNSILVSQILQSAYRNLTQQVATRLSLQPPPANLSAASEVQN